MKELKEFIRFHIQNSRFAVLLANAKEISSPVVEAIEKLIRKVEDKDIDLKEVSEPIVEAQKQTTEAVKAIPKTEIDFTGLEAHLEALKAVLEEKKLEVNIGETKLDLNPVTKAIQKLEKSMPKMEKQVVIDYTALIGEVIQKIEGNKVDLSSLEKCFTNLATSSDLSVLAEWLRVISEKEVILPEFRFDDDGKLLVKVDKVGGGGMGLTSIQEALLQSLSDNQETGLAKETKQDTIIENQTDGTQKTQIVNPTGDTTETIRLTEDGGYTYVGEAIPGAVTSEAVWRIYRVDSDGNLLYADGDSDYDNIYDDVLSLTYT